MLLRSIVPFLASGLLVAACQAEPNGSRQQPTDEMPRGSGVVKRAVSLEARDVTWPARSRIDREVVSALPARVLSELRASPVPVLAPRLPALLREAVLTTGDHWAALSVRDDGISLALQASGKSVRHEGIGPIRGNRALRGGHGFITQETGIWSASWIENGVAYSADLECAAPVDQRCETDAYLVELVAGLAFVGGREVAP